jgi:hypothetical protein
MQVDEQKNQIRGIDLVELEKLGRRILALEAQYQNIIDKIDTIVHADLVTYKEKMKRLESSIKSWIHEKIWHSLALLGGIGISIFIVERSIFYFIK